MFYMGKMHAHRSTWDIRITYITYIHIHIHIHTHTHTSQPAGKSLTCTLEPLGLIHVDLPVLPGSLVLGFRHIELNIT